MSTETKFRRVVQVLAIFDMALALCVVIYASYQFSHGEQLIPGSLRPGEKISRLAIYAALNYIFLSLQIIMAITLLNSANKVLQNPTIHALQIFARWRAWSIIYLLFLLLDLVVVSLLMDFNRRKIVSIILLVIQILFRPIGILLIRHFEQMCLLLYDTSNTIASLP